jgi:chemotaxis protein histidine kinase CheA
MEDRGLRDIERWRDKIEVRLDNRQVFFLFFGSALVACMLFVLGVIVGKRLESRGRALSPEIEDPLALLDKVATSPRPAQGGVTFPQALFGAAGKTGSADKNGKKLSVLAPTVVEHGGEAAKPAAAAAKPAEAATKTPAATAAKSAEAATKTPAAAAAKPAEPAAKSPVAPTPENKAAPAKPQAKPAAAAAEEKKPEAAKAKLAEAKPAEAKAAAAKAAKPAPIPTIAAAGDSKTKGRFSLQLSSFQDKAEAEAFAQKFAGERPYMVVSDIPGKGIWYRVRVGDFASSKDAVAAKEAFEKKHNVIAYVAQR